VCLALRAVATAWVKAKAEVLKQRLTRCVAYYERLFCYGEIAEVKRETKLKMEFGLIGSGTRSGTEGGGRCISFSKG
jgi:hypothetical protein